MRWGVGTNNVDFSAFADHNIPVDNTPVYLEEVADLACHYVTALARKPLNDAAVSRVNGINRLDNHYGAREHLLLDSVILVRTLLNEGARCRCMVC